MRKDMFKVIVERPRGGAGLRVNRSRLSGENDLPSRVGMKRFRSINQTQSKWLNENLAPLKRYLMKQIGRPWSKVYSEICENLDANNTVKQHVRDHLQDFVVTKVAIGKSNEWMNGNAQTTIRWGGVYWRQPLYVDPYDGILKRSDKLWKKKRFGIRSGCKSECAGVGAQIIKLNDNSELRRLNGVWFEVKFGVEEGIDRRLSAFDALTHLPVSQQKRHAISKRQLSSRELKARGLANEALD